VAQDVADAQSHRAAVVLREVTVEQVGTTQFAGGEYLFGIFRLVSKRLPGRVTRPRARASFRSRAPSSPASMMKPRSAPVTPMAASSTSTSTSSSTRPEPSARRPSSRVAIWRMSPTAVPADDVPEADSDASVRNTTSAPPVRPNCTRSPCVRRCSVTGAPLTKVP
jgi:hypothetical protein